MLRIEVLGPIRVVDESGVDLTPSGPLQRRLLAALVLHAGRNVDADRLADVLWPRRLPQDHTAALQTHVFRLRRSLPGVPIVSDPPGYRLEIPPESIDACMFDLLVAKAAACRITDPQGSLTLLDSTIGLWHGAPFAELDDVDDAVIERSRLYEVWCRSQEERFEVLIEIGRHGEALADLDAFAARFPTRERPHALLMRCLELAGRRVDALRVFDSFRRRLAEDLGLDPSPELSAHHDRIVRNERPPDAAAHPPTSAGDRRSASTSRTPTVPRPLTALIGRDEDVDAVVRRLDEVRLLTIVGTGGVGKTRFALEVCDRRRDRHGDGVWFFDLAMAEPGSAVDAVAATLGVEPRADLDAIERVALALRHAQALLVLDNAEHVLEEVAALVDRVLTTADRVTVLATSRERLAVDGEVLHPLAPLPRPQPGELASPAVQLFVERARAVRPDFDPIDGDRELVIDVCRRLDGLPLAIELAAARLQSLELVDVDAGLRRGLALLDAGRRGVPRHRSLDATIRWSHALLGQAEQDLFAHLAAFAGPFTVAHAAALVGRPADVVAPVLASLVERSLLQRSLVQRGAGRYRMLETIRHFASERLEQAGLVAEVERRHVELMITTAERARVDLRGARPAEAFDEVEAVLADLRLAHGNSMQRGRAGDVRRLCLALVDHGLLRMRHEVLAWADDAIELHDDDDPDSAELWAISGLAAWKRGDLVEAARRADRARRVSTPRGAAIPVVVLDACGVVALGQGRLDEARAFYDEALRSDECAADPVRRGELLSSALLARAYAAAPGVRDEVERLLAEPAVLDNMIGSAWAFYGAGEGLLDLDPAAARSHLATAVDLAERSGASFVRGIAGASLASLDARGGDPYEAVRAYRWLLDHWNRSGEVSMHWTMLRSVAGLLARLGHPHDAAVLLGAVWEPGTGHRLFGGDATRLSELAEVLRGQLGDDAFDAAFTVGRCATVEDAAQIARRVFDGLDAG